MGLPDTKLGHYQSTSTVLRTHPEDGDLLLQLRWSNKDRDNMRFQSEAESAEFYRAYHKFAKLMDDAKFSFEVRLEPGTFLVIDNWRVTHGRRPFVGKRTLQGTYIARDEWDGRHRRLDSAEADGSLEMLNAQKPDVRTSLRFLDEGTQEEFRAQGELWANLVEPAVLAKQMLGLLAGMDGEHTRFGFQVNGYQHQLQSATRAYRAGESNETVVVALLHDVGEAVFAANHGEIVAAMLRPFVSPESYFVLKYHDLFQGYHFAHHFGLDRNARERLKDSPHYQACVQFTDAYDQSAFDPSYNSLPLSFFEPMVHQLFKVQQYSKDAANPKRTVSWEGYDEKQNKMSAN